MNCKNQIYYIVIFSIVTSCANIVTPSGGSKDEIPPMIDTIFPPNGTLNFHQNKIEFHFNEYIEQSNITNNIIINPPINQPIKIKINGKSVTLYITDQLIENTTYTINFGDGIKDITEQNIATNLSYVFSTGNKLDSSSIKGQILNAITLKPEPNTLVLLHPIGSDTLFITSKPIYFSKTDKNGNFEINNIKPNEYQLYGLFDQNNNFYYDQPNEPIAFNDETIKLDTLQLKIDLKLFQENNISQKLLSIKSYRYGQTKIAFSKNTDSVIIKYIGDSTETILFEKTQKKDTITFWNSNPYLSKHTFKITFPGFDTIIEANVKSIPQDSSILKIKNQYFCNAKKLSKGNITQSDPLIWDINKKIIFSFQNPITFIDSNAFLIIDDSTKLPIESSVFIDTNKTIVILSASLNSNKKYQIKILQNATTDIFNLTNDSSNYLIKTKDIKDYSTITLHLKNTFAFPCILYLLNSQNEIVSLNYIASSENSKIKFEYLIPDNFTFKIIVDENKNSVWDTGNLRKKTQPESVYFYPAEIISKANWEVELEWELK